MDIDNLGGIDLVVNVSNGFVDMVIVWFGFDGFFL